MARIPGFVWDCNTFVSSSDSWRTFLRHMLLGALVLAFQEALVRVSDGVLAYEASRLLLVAVTAFLLGVLCADGVEKYFSAESLYRVYGAVWGYQLASLLPCLLAVSHRPGPERRWIDMAADFLLWSCLAPPAVLLLRAALVVLARRLRTIGRVIFVCALLALANVTYESAAKLFWRWWHKVPVLYGNFDLVINDAHVAPGLGLRYVVENRGTDYVPWTHVATRVYVNGRVWFDGIGPASLAGGGSQVVIHPLPQVQDCWTPVHFEIVVDPWDVVAERDERNNSASVFWREGTFR